MAPAECFLPNLNLKLNYANILCCCCLYASVPTCCRGRCQVSRCGQKVREACWPRHTQPGPTGACSLASTAPPTGWSSWSGSSGSEVTNGQLTEVVRSEMSSITSLTHLSDHIIFGIFAKTTSFTFANLPRLWAGRASAWVWRWQLLRHLKRVWPVCCNWKGGHRTVSWRLDFH